MVCTILLLGRSGTQFPTINKFTVVIISNSPCNSPLKPVIQSVALVPSCGSVAHYRKCTSNRDLCGFAKIIANVLLFSGACLSLTMIFTFGLFRSRSCRGKSSRPHQKAKWRWLAPDPDCALRLYNISWLLSSGGWWCDQLTKPHCPKNHRSLQSRNNRCFLFFCVCSVERQCSLQKSE